METIRASTFAELGEVWEKMKAAIPVDEIEFESIAFFFRPVRASEMRLVLKDGETIIGIVEGEG